ncbi:hypothetical protein [Streptomyces sp. ODS05-4]|uniref:hypothetical protein n=1 Tax=Streptomyces sp. ODS05-4 TaxID=2944939 RepID=UPI0035B246F5
MEHRSRGRGRQPRQQDPLKDGYSPASPHDQFADLRDTMVAALEDCGIVVEQSHHEVSSGGQTEIDYVFNTLLRSTDELQLLRYVVNTAWQHGKTVTLMLAALQGDNGNFGGVLRHAPGLLAFANTRRSTPITGCSPAMRHRSTSVTRRATARPVSASP